MIKFSMKTNFAGQVRKLKELEDAVRSKAIVSAVNKVAAQARTAMQREIGAEFNLKAGKIKEALKVRKARYVRGTASFEAVLESSSRKGRSLNLINFDAKKVASGVSIKIKRSTGRKIIKSAFIANKGRTVFKRVPGTRTADRKWGKTHGEQIEAVQTIEVAQMFNTKRINAKVVRFIESKFPAIMDNEMRFFINRFNQGKQ